MYGVYVRMLCMCVMSSNVVGWHACMDESMYVMYAMYSMQVCMCVCMLSYVCNVCNACMIWYAMYVMYAVYVCHVCRVCALRMRVCNVGMYVMCVCM